MHEFVHSCSLDRDHISPVSIKQSDAHNIQMANAYGIDLAVWLSPLH